MAKVRKTIKQSAVLGLTIFLDGSTIIKPPQIDYYFWIEDGLDSGTALGGWLGDHNLAGTSASVIISDIIITISSSTSVQSLPMTAACLIPLVY